MIADSEETITLNETKIKKPRLATTEIAEGVTACIPGHECAVCGKSFILHVSQGQSTASYVYKVNGHMCCSYHCWQELKRLGTAKRVKGGYLNRGKREQQ